MWLEDFLRNQLRRLLAKENHIALEKGIPLLDRRLQDIDEFGLYLHIPFCRQICPYCPYNKEIYRSEVAGRYADAVKKEIDLYSDLIGNRPVTSFYIGGGTPTTMLYSGLDRILEHVFKAFNVQCDLHMESHPNDLSSDNLNTIVSLGVEHLSIGVEALQDHHLKALHRPYTVEQVRAAVERAVGKSFKCVNADSIFALPNQTYSEVEQAGYALVYRSSSVFKRRKMLGILERIFYDAGFERTSVWAFTKSGVVTDRAIMGHAEPPNVGQPWSPGVGQVGSPGVYHSSSPGMGHA